MKLSPVLLAASVLGNVALAALIISHSSPSAAETNSSHAGSAAAGSSGSGGKATDLSNIDPKLWGDLTAGDNAAMVARLRAEGFPPAIVRAIAMAQLNESFAARRKALLPPRTDQPFWMPERPVDAETQKALRELSREQANALKDLLGPNHHDEQDPMYAAALRRQYGDLPAEKIDQLSKMRQDYDELRNEIYQAAPRGTDGEILLSPNDRAKIALLEKEQRTDLQSLMSPKEYEDYQLRSSPTANLMRSQLSAFKPSEQEFRAIFALQSAYDEQYRGQIPQMIDGSISGERAREAANARKDLIDQIKATLGPERGADYERSIDGNYQQIDRVVQRLELPPATAVTVWNVQKETEQRLNAIRQDRSVSPAARDAQVAALAQETTSKLTAALGERGLDVYKQYGGNWLQNLQPRPINLNGVPGASGSVERGRIIRVPR